jgi:CTP:molybdopterin cytidylyltransferase MocA
MKIAGVVLAAGASRRMGRRKALLRNGKQTFLDSLCTAIRTGGCNPVLAVVAEPVWEIENNCRLDGVQLVLNPDPSRGQISSLRCAISHLSADVDGALVVLVDQAEISPGTVREVRLALEGHDAAVAQYNGRSGHPACFGRSLFEALQSPAAEGGAREVIAACERSGRLSRVDLDDPGVVRNLNTPGDFESFSGG